MWAFEVTTHWLQLMQPGLLSVAGSATDEEGGGESREGSGSRAAACSCGFGPSSEARGPPRLLWHPQEFQQSSSAQAGQPPHRPIRKSIYPSCASAFALSVCERVTESGRGGELWVILTERRMGARPEVPPTGNENEPLSGRRISARITRGARGRLSKCVASKVDSMKGCAVRRAFLPSHSTCLKRFIASRCQCNAGYCHKGAFASCIKGTKGPSSAPHSKSKAGHHGLPAFSHWQEALHSATPTFSYGLGHWEISHTGHFANFYSACKLSVTCFGLQIHVCFSYSQLASRTNGCLSFSLELSLQTNPTERGTHCVGLSR